MTYDVALDQPLDILVSPVISVHQELSRQIAMLLGLDFSLANEIEASFNHPSDATKILELEDDPDDL
jgi:hypothetical protein